MKFSVYIDESGEAGISKIRGSGKPGASQYLVLGAVVCAPTAEVHLKNMMEEFRRTIRKQSWRHATDLGHFEKVFLAREVNRMPVRLFSVV